VDRCPIFITNNLNGFAFSGKYVFVVLHPFNEFIDVMYYLAQFCISRKCPFDNNIHFTNE